MKLRKHFKSPIASVAIGALAISLATLGGSTVAGASARAQVHRASAAAPINIVQPPITTLGDGVFAAFYKYLHKNHVPFKLTTVTTPTNILRVLLAGKAQFAMATPIPTLTAVGTDHVKLKFLAADAASTEYWLVANPKYTLHNLAGATLGTAGPGSVDAIIATAALEHTHVTIKGLNQVAIGDSSARMTALLAGKIDLANATAAVAEAALATGKAKLLMNTGDALKPFLQQGLVATTTYIQKNKSLVNRVVESLVEAERFSNTQENAYIALANKSHLRAGLTNQQEHYVYRTLKKGGYFAPNGGVCKYDIQHTVELSVVTKQLAKKTVIPYSKWIDPSFVKQFLKTHGGGTSDC